MRFAYWITKATDTYSEYVTLIASFFYCNNGLFERASLLRCTYIGCLVGCLVFLSFPIATFSNLFAKSKSTFSHVTANTGFVSTVHVSNMSVTPVTRLVLFIMCKKDVFYSI
jgi:hypothetical protein